MAELPASVNAKVSFKLDRVIEDENHTFKLVSWIRANERAIIIAQPIKSNTAISNNGNDTEYSIYRRNGAAMLRAREHYLRHSSRPQRVPKVVPAP